MKITTKPPAEIAPGDKMILSGPDGRVCETTVTSIDDEGSVTIAGWVDITPNENYHSVYSRNTNSHSR